MLFAVCQLLAHLNAIMANAWHLTGVGLLRRRVYLIVYLGGFECCLSVIGSVCAADIP
jgi:hypothetical protein